MADEPKKPEEKPVEPVEEPKEEGYDYRKDHNRSAESIIKEPVVEKKPTEPATDKPKEEPKPEEKPKEPEKLEEPAKPVLTPLEEAKQYLDEQRKATIEAAKIEAKRSVSDEVTKTKEQEVAAAKLAEDLKPSWEKEGRAPADYDEIARENRRITKLELKQELKAEQDAAKAEQDKVNQQTQEATAKQTEAIQSKIGRDLEELYEGGYMTRPKSADPTDAGEIEKAALFNMGIKINNDLRAAGKEPIDSIAKIYFMHYQKTRNKPEQPAGADAPVAGAKPAINKPNDEEYSYAKDHKKTYNQLVAEAMRKN